MRRARQQARVHNVQSPSHLVMASRRVVGLSVTASYGTIWDRPCCSAGRPGTRRCRCKCRRDGRYMSVLLRSKTRPHQDASCLRPQEERNLCLWSKEGAGCGAMATTFQCLGPVQHTMARNVWILDSHVVPRLRVHFFDHRCGCDAWMLELDALATLSEALATFKKVVPCTTTSSSPDATSSYITHKP